MTRAIVLLLCSLTFAAACERQNAPLVLSGQTMGTTFSVVLYDRNIEPSLDELQSDIDAALESINALASTYRTDSAITGFNEKSSTEWQPVGDEFCGMVESALSVSAMSDGAFDITVAPLVDLWGFGPGLRDAVVPEALAIDAALKAVGYSLIETDCARPAIRKRNPNVSIDLSGWAKGWAADEISALLRVSSIENFTVEIGGELQLSGHRRDGQGFRIALEHPASTNRQTVDILELTDTGVATSGDYQNYYEIDGQRYSHTIDPRSGRPIRHTLGAVSVIAPSTAVADALATAILVMGPEHGFRFAVENDIAAYLTEYVGDDVRTRRSPAFERVASQAL